MAHPQHDRLVYAPPRSRFVVLLVICLLIGLLGVVIIVLNLDNVVSLVIGAAAAGLFGVGGTISVIGQLRTPTIAADREGLRIGRGGRVPWSDLDRVGTTAQGKLGIRLRRADAFLASGKHGETTESLARTRTAEGGYDLVFTERELGAPAKEAAAAIRGFRS
ncbi:hypothetical protein [Microbacterium sp. GXF7504]